MALRHFVREWPPSAQARRARSGGIGGGKLDPSTSGLEQGTGFAGRHETAHGTAPDLAYDLTFRRCLPQVTSTLGGMAGRRPASADCEPAGAYQ